MKKYPFLFLLSAACLNVYAANEAESPDIITVTANKVEENILDVPQSITVIDREVLQDKNIDTIIKVMDEIPNMSGSKEHGFGTSSNFRGLNSSTFTNNNPVVIYIDGIPITDKYSYQASLVNVERVEVLRGPQGTLYGKDAIGGVINIITDDTPETMTGHVGAEYGSNNFLNTTFSLNAPLKEEILFAGINGSFRKDDGWITNEYNNDDEAAKSEDKNIRFFLKYKPSDRTDIKLVLSQDDAEESFINGGAVDSSIDINDLNRDSLESASYDMPTNSDTTVDSQSLYINHAFEDFDLSFITTHRNVKAKSVYDTDYSDVVTSLGLTQWSDLETETYTSELRFSNATDSGTKWIAGLYYDDEKMAQGPYGYESYYSGATYYANVDSVTDSNTKAIFGQVTFPIADDYELTLGGRYQNIEKEMDASAYSSWGGIPMSDFTLVGKKDWNVFLPKIAIAYQGFEGVTPFASVSKGYMPGGFNYFPASNDIAENTFDPQKSINYEIGVKGSLDDFIYTASVFYMDISDIHVYTSDGNNWYTDNAEKAHSYGLELEGTYFLSSNFDVSGSLGLIHSEYDKYEYSSTVNFNGQEVESTPSHTASLTFSYIQPHGLYGILDIKNQGSVYFYDNANSQFIKEKGHMISNIKVGYKFDGWDVYGYVNNITDEEYVTYYLSKTDLSVASFNDPRFIGVGARYVF